MKQNDVIIIAEAGVNHNGSVTLAKKMIEEAAAAGADYIKFQTFKTESLVTINSRTANYQAHNCGEDSQYEMLKKLELSFDDFRSLKDYCRQCGIGFLSTPFDEESLAFLLSLGMDYIKVPSGEITNLPLLLKIASSGVPVIISTGMSDMADIENVLKLFYKQGYTTDKITLLHCNTQYPTPFKDVNLLAMISLRKIFKVNTGYSDHTVGIEVSLAAAALGASIIEKHFTLDRQLKGPDHIVSLNPEELKRLVASVRNISEALGSEEKFVTDSERENMAVARKSIVAKRAIKKNETFTEENLTVKRPGSGLSPMLWDSVIGMQASRDFLPDDLITL